LFVFGDKKFMARVNHSGDTDGYRCLKYSWVPNIKDFDLANETAIFLVD
jgi:hypothetical protein